MKIHDVVRCVDSDGARTLKNGQEYKITEINPHGSLRLDNGVNTWYARCRFVKSTFQPHQIQHSGVPTMTTVKIGDKVRRNKPVARHNGGMYVGSIHEVVYVGRDGAVVRLADQGGSLWCMSCFAIEERAEDAIGVPVLPPEKVAEYLLAGKQLQYFHNERWTDVVKAGAISIQFMQTGCFRVKPMLIEVNGVMVPPPMVDLPKSGTIFGVSFSKREVYPCSARRTIEGAQYWSSPIEAQQVLEALLKPFPIKAKALDVPVYNRAVPTL